MPTEADPHAWSQRLQSVAIQSVRPTAGSAVRPHCANPSCHRGWFGFLKDRRRPIFEDRWACSGHCLRTLVEAAIRRESPATLTREAEHRHRIPLGLILLSRGWITQSQLQHVLAMQRHAGGGLLGRWLIEECGVPENHVLSALALQWHCDVFSLHNFDPREMALVTPREIIDRTAMLPLRISRSGTLRLAFTDRPNPAAALALERTANIKVQSGLLPHADWKLAREALLRCEPVRCSLEEVANRDVLSRRIASDIAGMQPRASRLVRVRQFFWLRMWLEDATLACSHSGIPHSREDILDRVYTIEAQSPA